MILHVANPIYDSVFKYLMEDERIAKTLLSALLKKTVITVEARRHEYTNSTRDKVSMFRIDFAAEVLHDDGNTELVLIELQKTWVDTETLRFRQYLGSQYLNPENIAKENNPNGVATPMIAVYLLGHCVGDIEEPVLYVNHKSYNYFGEEVTKGIPDPFVESLTHDSIIIQLPLLKGQINNRLYKVLSVFDQSRKDEHNRQLLNIEEEMYAGDEDMMYILRRLTSASVNVKMRQDMNVEDEYFYAIEKRDTELLIRDKKIKIQDAKIEKQNVQIEQQSEKIEQQSEKIEQQSEKIEQQSEKIEQQSEKIEQQSEKIEQQSEKIEQQSEKIEQQQIQIEQQSKALLTSAKIMIEAGYTKEQISQILGLPIDTI